MTTESSSTGEHPATNVEVKRWGIVPSVVAGLFSVMGTGGLIAFMIGWSDRVEAKSLAAAEKAVVTVGQRLDVMKGDVDVVKIQVATIDAGVSKDVRRLEQKIDDSAREQRASMEEVRKANAEILRRLPK